jgi:hypothetical protein
VEWDVRLDGGEETSRRDVTSGFYYFAISRMRFSMEALSSPLRWLRKLVLSESYYNQRNLDRVFTRGGGRKQTPPSLIGLSLRLSLMTKAGCVGQAHENGHEGKGDIGFTVALALSSHWLWVHTGSSAAYLLEQSYARLPQL